MVGGGQGIGEEKSDGLIYSTAGDTVICKITLLLYKCQENHTLVSSDGH
jgi:hypothetical protein